MISPIERGCTVVGPEHTDGRGALPSPDGTRGTELGKNGEVASDLGQLYSASLARQTPRFRNASQFRRADWSSSKEMIGGAPGFHDDCGAVCATARLTLVGPKPGP